MQRGVDVHQDTADNDRNFHDLMQILHGENWRQVMGPDEVRRQAKRWNFAKFYRAGRHDLQRIFRGA